MVEAWADPVYSLSSSGAWSEAYCPSLSHRPLAMASAVFSSTAMVSLIHFTMAFHDLFLPDF